MSTFHFRHCLPVQIIVYLLICGSVSLAQKHNDVGPSVKFGKISPEQFINQTKDSTAEAVVLYNLGQVSFEENGNDLWQVFTHHVRVKILKKSAYDRATIQLPVRRGTAGQHEFVSDFDGFTYNLTKGDVSINVLDKTGHFTERVTDVISLEKYTLPNVREGSIIEYKYTVHTPFSVSYNPKTWRFQQDIPVSWSEYRIKIPDYFYYKIMQGGYLSLAVSDKKPTNMHLFSGQPDVGAVAYRFAVQDAPAFRDEAFITTDDDYLSKIDFELASYQLPGGMKRDYSVSWTALDKTLLDHASFGSQIKRTGFLKETAKALLSQHRDTLSRITAAYDFIRQNIKWNEQVSIWSDNLKKVFDDKKGDAGDINLLLIALLREMDIEAHPVILSTRSHGRIYEEYALLKRFDYVVASVSVNSKDMLLDATDSYLKPGMLPLHCLNGSGRVIHPTQARFVSLVPVERDIEVQTGQFTLDEEGEVSGTLTHSHAGYSAWSARKVFAADGRAKYVEGIRKKRTSWQIEKAEFNGTDAKSNTFDVVYNFTIPEACTRAGDRLYFRPLLSEAHGTNPFKEAQRLYPVDFGVLTDETFAATYTLPAGYQVEELPKPVSMSLPENTGRFIYNVAVINGGSHLQVISRISLRKTMYFAEEYPSLRELFSQIVAKHAEQVVLKRSTIAEKK